MSIDPRLLSNIVPKIKRYFSIPILFYEADMPLVLPKYNPVSSYSNLDLSIYDGFISNSKGVEQDLIELGAQKVFTLYYAADPDLYARVPVPEDIDVFFFAYGSRGRERWINALINKPSLVLRKARFAVGGRLSVLPSVKNLGDIPFSQYRTVCCRSKVCLNIPRPAFAEVYGSSNVRPFELAALGECFIMNPSLGIAEWFEPGKEIIVPSSEEEVLEIYAWLLDNTEERQRIGRRANERLLKEHTYRHRAKQLLDIIKSVGN